MWWKVIPEEVTPVAVLPMVAVGQPTVTLFRTTRTLVVVEEAAMPGFATPEGFDELERRNYDESALTVLRHRA